MKVLITGGAGYVGSLLSRKLLSKGYQVRVMDALWYGKQPIEECLTNENFELVQDDIRNLTSIVRAMKDVDAVIHLASIVGMPASSIEPRTSEEINYLASKNIAELCELHGIDTYIFSSTCSVYGAQPICSEIVPPVRPPIRGRQSRRESWRRCVVRCTPSTPTHNPSFRRSLVRE